MSKGPDLGRVQQWARELGYDLIPHYQHQIALAMTFHGRNVPERAFIQWVVMLKQFYWPGPVFIIRDLYVLQARNLVVKGALNDPRPWSHLLSWDSDQIPPGTMAADLQVTCQAMAANPEFGVATGMYFQRHYPFEVNASTRIDTPEESTDGNTGYRQLQAPDMFQVIAQRGLYEVDGAGAGFLLIRRDVLERFRAEDGDHVFKTPAFDGVQAMRAGVWGEDLYFCREAQDRFGYKIYLDSRLEARHVREDEVDHRHYLAAHQQDFKAELPSVSQVTDFETQAGVKVLWTPADARY